VTDHRAFDEHPELLLAGADRPRPLPPGLRSRLEDALTGPSSIPGPDARPLSAEVRDRLESSLRPGAAPTRGTAMRREKWRTAMALAGAAAVIAIAATVVPGLVHRPPGSSTASRSLTHKDLAAPSAAVRRQVMIPNSPVPAAPARHNRPTTQNVPAAAGPAKPAAKSAHRPGPTAPGGVPSRKAASQQVALVAGVEPGRGPTGGGNWVVVSGQGLTGTKAVYFGDVAALGVSAVSSREVKVRAPAHSPGPVELKVVASSGSRAQVVSPAADRYFYLPSPGSGAPAAGGT
jgi:IPT/TIG domain